MPRTRQVLCAALAALAALALLPAAAFAGEGGVTIDPGHFPDADFRAWLTDPANLDGAGRDGVFSQAELAAVTELDVSGRQIADLTGVEHFFALETLNANNNRLTALDVSANTRLKYLYCATNALTSLEIRGCGELVDLNCERNRLTALDLSGNPKLERLYCRHNALETLDVSGNPELAFIETFDNRLLEFDGSMLKKLKFLHIDYNRLTHLDMSGNPALEGNGFVAANNWLDALTLPDIADFQVEAAVFCEQNPRTGYDRVEWYQDAACTRPIGEEDLLPANGQTVYARWIPNPYTVYYRPNGGEGSMADQPVVYDQTFDLARNGFARAGYTFTGGGIHTPTQPAAGVLPPGKRCATWRAKTAAGTRCTCTPNGPPTPTASATRAMAARERWPTPPRCMTRRPCWRNAGFPAAKGCAWAGPGTRRPGSPSSLPGRRCET